MKHISSLTNQPHDTEVQFVGWVVGKRDHGGIIFFDVEDQTGYIQVVAEHSVPNVKLEDNVRITGKIKKDRDPIEVYATEISIVASFDSDLYPRPRQFVDFLTTDKISVDNKLSNRHIYIRNKELRNVMLFRNYFFRSVRELFEEAGFVEIHAPIITELILYEPHTAFDLKYFRGKAFLTQCVGFYLEAYIHAFDRVYNLGPSFRAETSTGRRHLAEYWHVKAELAHVSREDLISFVESFIRDLIQKLKLYTKDIVSPDTPILQMNFTGSFPRITYREAIAMLQEEGISIPFGQSLSANAEDTISSKFTTPFWIVGLPKSIEPFPYVIDPDDPEVTMTADLHAPNGYGELLGIAEKSHSFDEVMQRVKEKNISDEDQEKLRWYLDLRKAACVPHGGMGMGVERTLRWLLGLAHVRDAIPFPRLYDRRPSP